MRASKVLFLAAAIGAFSLSGCGQSTKPKEPSVADLEAKIAALESRVDDLEGRVSDHDDKLEKLDTDVTDLTSRRELIVLIATGVARTVDDLAARF
jgi:outer membrane murein-binding lipoprotein Lpp